LLIIFAAAVTAAFALIVAINAAPRVEEKQKGKEWHVIVDSIPSNLDEFRAFRNAIAITPQGGIVVYLVAQLIMIDKPEFGEQCIVIALDRSELSKSNPASRRPSVDGWQIGTSEAWRMQTSSFQRAKSYVAKSYVAGTSTAGGYALPPLPYRYVIRAHAYQSSDPAVWKGLASTSCSDLGYVPIHVKRNDKGIWKVVNSSSFYAGCKPPPSNESDDL